MPRYIAVHSLPFDEKELLGMFQELAPQIPEGFAWNQSWCDCQNAKHFCEWQAPSAEALEQAFSANKIPYDAVYPVKHFDVATMQFEP